MGYNLKMIEVQGAMGVAQMEKLPGFVETRRKNYKYLANRFEEEQLTSFFRYVKAQPHTNPSPFGFPLIIEDPHIQKQALMQYLDKAGIATRPVFAGNVLRQPYMEEWVKKDLYDNRYKGPIYGSFPNADIVMNSAFWIGVYPGLTQEQLEFMVQTFKAFCMGLK
jgi:CDP-6-deoxy-D-xylo-4-hexulose-3-dehydrase